MESKSVISPNNPYDVEVSNNITVTMSSDAASALVSGINKYFKWQDARFKPDNIETHRRRESLSGLKRAMDIEDSQRRTASIDIDTYEEAEELIRSIDFLSGEKYSMVKPLQESLRNHKIHLDKRETDVDRGLSKNKVRSVINDGVMCAVRKIDQRVKN